MNATANQARQIFVTAVKLAPDEWDAYLAEACGKDEELRGRVRKLLAAHLEAGTFLAGPAAGVGIAVDHGIVEKPGTIIGPYKLLEQIGEGGFGVVFMAEQMQPIRRRVALKVVKPGMDTRQVVARFEAERQALAIMDHPNIAHVIDGGETASGRPFFVMELVRGIPVTDFADQNHLSIPQRLELFASVCLAVQHAHQKGIIHRDLKPANILVTLHDAKPVIKVIDFGIAKATGQQLTDKTLFTSFVQMLGTPMYMSPEQAQLSGLDIDTRSDVYSLGVLLYELLTGTTPFDEARLRTAAYDEIRRIIREEDPPKPSTRLSTVGQAATTLSAKRQSDPKRLSRLFRGELDWIVMRCLEKDRNRRYESASALTADIERYLRDDPVQACPPSSSYRVRKFVRKHKAGLATASAMGLALLLAVGGLAFSNARIASEQENTKKALEAETQAKEELKEALGREQRNFFQYAMGMARRDWLAGDMEQTRRNLKACPPLLRDADWRYLDRVCRAEVQRFKPAGNAGRVLYSPDGKSIACAGTGAFAVLTVLDAATGQQQFGTALHGMGNSALAFSADGKKLTWAGLLRPRLSTFNPKVMQQPDAFAVFIYDVANGKHVAGFNRNSATIASVQLSPDGSRVALVDLQRSSICESAAGQELFSLATPADGGKRTTFRPVFHPAGKVIASFGDARTLRYWDGATGKSICNVRMANDIRLLAFSPDGRFLMGATFDAPAGPDAVIVWDAQTGKEVAVLRGHTGTITDLVFSPDSRRLASAGSDKSIIIWDLDQMREQLTFRGHTGAITGLAFSPDGQRLASTSSDGTLRIWNADPGDEITESKR